MPAYLRNSFLLFLFCLFLQGFSLSAQNTELSEEIKKHVTKEEYILKARDLLLNSLENKNYEKSQQIIWLLDSLIDPLYNISPINEREKLLAQLLGRNFKHLLNEKTDLNVQGMNKIENSFSRYTYPYRFYHYNDLFSKKINDLVKKNEIDIKAQIENDSSMNQEEKEFLYLLSNYLIYSDPHSPSDSVNAKADRFLSAYPNSQYKAFVEKVIRRKYKPRDWGINYEIGLGAHFSTDFLGTTFKNGFAFGFTAGATCKNALLSVDVHIGATSPNLDIRNNDTTWEKNHRSTITQFATHLGYIFAADRKLSIIPSVGIGTTSIHPSISEDNNDNDYYEDVGYKAKVAYYASLGLKYKLNEIKNIHGNSHGYLMLKYRFSEPKLDAGYRGVSGQIHMITLCWGGFYRGNKRVQ